MESIIAVVEIMSIGALFTSSLTASMTNDAINVAAIILSNVGPRLE